MSVITSCRTLSCASVMPPAKPMRLAGTCSRYSASAMPQLTRAAIHHGLACRCFRCPYHANVMKRLERASNVAVAARVCRGVIEVSFGTRNRGSGLTEVYVKLALRPAYERSPEHGPAPHHFTRRSARRARARDPRPASRDRALVPHAVDGERGAVLHLGGPAQQRFQAGAGR